MKRFSISIILTSLVFLMGSFPVFAAVPQEVQQAADKVQTSVDELLTIQDTELSEEEKLAEELEARKNVLRQVFELSFKELEDLQAKLSSFQNIP